jgi:hypothetical protein
MNRIIPLLLSCVVLIGLALPAAAREWRGCTARIHVFTPWRAAVVWQFEGRGSCRSRVYGNDCRRAARGAIGACLTEAWARRWERRLPGSCFPVSGSNRPFVQGIGGTSFGRGPGSEGDQDFKWAVERAACCTMGLTGRNVSVTVGGSSSGDTGCALSGEGIDWQLESNYVVNCRSFRNKGYCG